MSPLFGDVGATPTGMLNPAFDVIDGVMDGLDWGDDDNTDQESES
jgi:hypothetical protein